jgi:hypothetical protein
VTAYQHDPRIHWADNEMFYLPDHNSGLWNTGSEWSIEFDGKGWYAFDPDANRVQTDADGCPDFDALLHAILGPPLWAIEAGMIRWAAQQQGWLNASNDDPPEGDEPDTGSCAGSAAIDCLIFDGGIFDGGIFRYCLEPGQPHLGDLPAGREVVGYMLTDRGAQLASELERVLGDAWDIAHGPLWDLIQGSGFWSDAERLIITEIPQTHAYGVSGTRPEGVMA